MKTKPLKLAGALGHEAADKRIDILRRIGDAGSISEAARASGVSYKAAWQAIDTLGNLAGTALVARAVGGSGGGGATLTEAGRQLLLAADEMGRARDEVLARLARRKGSAAQVGGPAGLGLRTSMRNQLPCTVKSLKPKGAMVRVQLALADGTALASLITRESAQLLALAPGLGVLALCKATAVQVGAEVAAAEGRNLLPGRVTRTSRAAAGGEVALALAAGLQLVGFASPGHGLKLHDAARAGVEEVAVVIALAG
jgi:molybdate transport system regulatory protein